MNDRGEVAISGLGVVSPLGVGVDEYWKGLCEGGSGPVDAPELSQIAMRHRHAYRASPSFPAPLTAREFALAAARQALLDANLLTPLDLKMGVSVGNAMGDHPLERAFVEEDGAKPDECGFRLAGWIANEFGLDGPVSCISTACSAGLYAISMACDLIRSGEVDAMLVGGTEAVSRVALACFNSLSALDPVCCRPFDRHRRGTVMGEGAAFLVLESARSARERGRDRRYGAVGGAGWTCDAFHITAPEPEATSAIRAAQIALAQSDLAPEDIDCVLAHGTGTEKNDLIEAKVIASLLRDRATLVPTYAVKGSLGHSGGSAGAFQCLTAALIFANNAIPPNRNLEEIDERCGLRLHREPLGAENVRHVLVNSYAFGGNNVSVIVSR